MPALTSSEYSVPSPVPVPSVGVTMKLTIPAEVGVPLMLIVPVPLPLIVNPVAFVTRDTARVTGATPPVEVIVWL